MAALFARLGVATAVDGVALGATLWLGLGVTFSAWPVIFANQPAAIWLINNGAFLIICVTSGAILGAIR